MRIIIYLIACCLCIAACAWVGYKVTGLLFVGSGYELGSRQIGQFVGAFAAGTAGFMGVASLSITFSRQLTKFFDPLTEMKE